MKFSLSASLNKTNFTNGTALTKTLKNFQCEISEELIRGRCFDGT